MLDFFYSDYERNLHVSSDRPNSDDLPTIMGLMDEVLIGNENFLGVVDVEGITLQFAVKEDGSVWMEIPVPSEGGSYGKLSTLEECKKALQGTEGVFNRQSVQGLEFESW